MKKITKSDLKRDVLITLRDWQYEVLVFFIPWVKKLETRLTQESPSARRRKMIPLVDIIMTIAEMGALEVSLDLLECNVYKSKQKRLTDDEYDRVSTVEDMISEVKDKIKYAMEDLI